MERGYQIDVWSVIFVLSVRGNRSIVDFMGVFCSREQFNGFYLFAGTDWVLAGIFADDGISGTNTKKREEFNRMIGECMAGNIDMVITKSISRFARNTLDCLKYIRQLKEKSIPVFFEKKDFDTANLLQKSKKSIIPRDMPRYWAISRGTFDVHTSAGV